MFRNKALLMLVGFTAVASADLTFDPAPVVDDKDEEDPTPHLLSTNLRGHTPQSVLSFETKNTPSSESHGNITTSSEDDNRSLSAQYVLLCRHVECDRPASYRAYLGENDGDYPEMPNRVGNDALSRAFILQGASLELFEHTNFRGWHRTYGSLDRPIDVNLRDKLSGNDEVSSFKIRKIPSSDLVKLCKHPDCEGGGVYAAVGSYNSMPSEIGNDQLSFVEVPRGFTFEYFVDENFRGFSQKFGGPVALYFANGNANDKTSSFIVGVADWSRWSQ